MSSGSAEGWRLRLIDLVSLKSRLQSNEEEQKSGGAFPLLRYRICTPKSGVSNYRGTSLITKSPSP